MLQEFLAVLRLNGCLPVKSSLPQSLHTPAEPLGTNRVYLRNGKGGSVRLPDSVPQAGSMEDDAVQLQSLQMEQAAEAILLEVGEDLLRAVRGKALSSRNHYKILN